MSDYSISIGLEIHVELATKTKIFCGCSTAFGKEANTQVCPVCMGMAGSLPVLNRKVVEYAIAVGCATHCHIPEVTLFDRKNYFYPDNPQNYQISQLYHPICQNGWIETSYGKVGIHEIHMEEDAGKLIHDEEKQTTIVDYNRAGVPLIEIVTEPQMHCAEEVEEFLEILSTMIRYLKVSDCKLNEGSMRVDVNLSVSNNETLGVRTETKNLNSFKAITRCIKHESKRQIAMLESGGSVSMQTRRWDDNLGESYVMRSKEDARDYRYFPEPDLKPLRLSQEWIKQIEKQQPEFQSQKIQRFMGDYGLPKYDAQVLTMDVSMADFVDATIAQFEGEANQYSKKVANWLMGETMRLQKVHQMSQGQIPFSPKDLAELILMLEEGTINGTTGKEIFEKMFEEQIHPSEYAREHGLMILDDLDEIIAIVQQVIDENPKSVEDYHGGKKQALGYLVGQVMKASGGKANPKKVNEILTERMSII